MGAFSSYRGLISPDEFDQLGNKAYYKTRVGHDQDKKYSFEKLLYFSMRRVCMDFIRDNKKMKSLRDEMPADIVSETCTLSENVRDCIEALPEHFQEIINQKYYLGMTIMEIARTHGYCERTAKTNLQLARKAFKELYLDD